MNTYLVTANKSNFCGLFKKRTNFTAPNIISGVRACGIFPYNPSTIPNETGIAVKLR